MSMSPLTDFIASPGLAGAFGALMDEYARAAAELCRVVEAVPSARFVEEVDGGGEFPTVQAICTHVVRAAYGHADHIRKALDIAAGERPRGQELVPEGPERLRPLLGAALRYTEATVAGLRADPAFAAEYGLCRAVAPRASVDAMLTIRGDFDWRRYGSAARMVR